MEIKSTSFFEYRSKSWKLELTRRQYTLWVIESSKNHVIVLDWRWKVIIWTDFSHLSNRSEIQRITLTLLVYLYLLLFRIYRYIANVKVKHWRCCISLRHESCEKSFYMVIPHYHSNTSTRFLSHLVTQRLCQ